MKKILCCAIFLMPLSAYSGYLDTGYSYDSEMSEDVALLAQASLLYKSGSGRKVLKAVHRTCKGIEIKVSKTSNMTPNMKRWEKKVDGICSGYNY